MNGSVVLAGDIGGTKTRLGLFVRGKNRPLMKVMESYESREAPHLTHIIERFMAHHPVTVSGACFGIAGPVIRGEVQATNLPWTVSGDEVQKHFGWPRIRVINDLAATALAIPFLHSRELHSIVNGRAVSGRAKVLIAPGTGLGTAILSLLDGKYLFISSEGGHMDFAPNNDVQVRLWQYLRTRYGHVSVERVVSGSGLMNIYGFLRDSEGMAEPKWLTRRMKDTDPAAAITEGALKRKTPICVRAVDMFVSALGAVSGNMALAGLALGGVYLGGGIPPKILQRLKQEDFKKAYLEKGRFKRLLRGIPVRVILDDRAPLLGAASAALDE